MVSDLRIHFYIHAPVSGTPPYILIPRSLFLTEAIREDDIQLHLVRISNVEAYVYE